MKPNEINKRIAIACGWKFEFNGDYEDPKWEWISPKEDDLSDPPNYYSDLNAMHEAENYIMDENSIEYLKWLNKLSCQWHASAPKRAEAFLRTIGQWEDVK